MANVDQYRVDSLERLLYMELLYHDVHNGIWLYFSLNDLLMQALCLKSPTCYVNMCIEKQKQANKEKPRRA